MNWEKFEKARNEFREYVENLKNDLPELTNVLQKIAGEKYRVKTPVVYNEALDGINENNCKNIELILVADNPGKNEQEKNRYLVGSAGKNARKNFSEIGYNFKDEEFEKKVIVLNKTPIHTHGTKDLKILGKNGYKDRIKESQEKMADLLIRFQEALGVPIWIVGISEMKRGGIFEDYNKKIKDNKQVYFYKHFAYGNFIKDFRQRRKKQPDEAFETLLKQISDYNRSQMEETRRGDNP